MAKKKSAIQIGNEAEEEYAQMKREQGCLAFVRARKTRFGSYDMFSEFDVFSMGIDGIEFCQVKVNNPRDARAKMKQFIMENVNRIPHNARFVLATKYDKTGWVIKEIDF